MTAFLFSFCTAETDQLHLLCQACAVCLAQVMWLFLKWNVSRTGGPVVRGTSRALRHAGELGACALITHSFHGRPQAPKRVTPGPNWPQLCHDRRHGKPQTPKRMTPTRPQLAPVVLMIGDHGRPQAPKRVTPTRPQLAPIVLMIGSGTFHGKVDQLCVTSRALWHAGKLGACALITHSFHGRLQAPKRVAPLYYISSTAGRSCWARRKG